MILVLKMIGIILLVFMGIFLSMLFIRLKVLVQGSYYQQKGMAAMHIFWIKYLFGIHCKIYDTEHVHIVVWILFIPIPFKLPLKYETKQAFQKKEQETKIPRFEKERSPVDKKTSITEQIGRISEMKGQFYDLWKEYMPQIRKIYVRYITISCESLTARVGFPEPHQTGMIAGIAYFIKPLGLFPSADIQWDYTKPGIEGALKTKITMKLYGILYKLLNFYWLYKKGKNNEIK